MTHLQEQASMLSTVEADVWAGLLWRTTWQAAVLTAIVLILTRGLRRWITPKWRSRLWLIPACRFLAFLVPASALSMFNLFASGHIDPSLDTKVQTVLNPGSHTRTERSDSDLAIAALTSPSRSIAMTEESPARNLQASSGSIMTSRLNEPLPKQWFSPALLLVTAWLIGCCWAATCWARSQLMLRRIVARGRPVTDSKLLQICDSRQHSIRLRRKIRCVIVDQNVGPAVCGLFRPTILFPSRLLRDLSDEQLHTIIVHEIEHVRRWDGVCCSLCRLVTTIHWFNPLAYLIQRQVRFQTELAVDASTIAVIGERNRQPYGELLIKLAQHPARIQGLAYMAARRSSLHARMDELVAPTESNHWRTSFACFVAVALIACGLTDTALTQTIDTETNSLNDQNSSSSVTDRNELLRQIHTTSGWRFIDADFIDRIEGRQAELQGDPITVRGLVIDEQQDAVPGAFVVLRLPSNSSIMRLGADGRTKEVFAVGWTDGDGRFAFEDQPTPWFESGSPLRWEICVFAPGYAIAARTYPYFDSQETQVTLRLNQEHEIHGTIKDADGNPIEQLELSLLEIVDPYQNAAIEVSFLHSELNCVVRTDDRGNFRIGGLPSHRIVSIDPVGSTAAARVIRVATSTDLATRRMIAEGRPRSSLVYPYYQPTFEIPLQRNTADRTAANSVALDGGTDQASARTVTVHVVNAETGDGVQGVGVGWRAPRNGRIRISPGMASTNREGIAELRIPSKSTDIYIGGRCYGFVTHYDRLTTNPDEYTPALEQSEWLQTIEQGNEDLEVSFELRPVAPLQIKVQNEDGTPAEAEIRILRRGWERRSWMPPFFSNKQGQATIPVRPVMFDIDIVATTKNGLQGIRSLQLSREFQQPDIATIIVK
ncbi:M56 family metallopeptidase [Roseiconus lacunae]